MQNTELADFKYILSDDNIDWSAFIGKTVLISGANGALALYLAKTLLYLNSTKKYAPVKVIGLVKDLNKAKMKYGAYFNVDNLRLIKQDVAMPFNIDESIDYIIHAASYANPKYFFSNPVETINANVLGTNNLLSLAKEKNVKSFLYFSSGEVNGDAFDKYDTVRESDYGIVNPLEVRNCYAESKRLGENMCVSWNRQFGVPAKIVRPSHTYGAGFDRNDDRAFVSFVYSIIDNKNIVLKSDGKAKRSFCYIADAARAYFTVLLKGTNAQAYNVAAEKEISILELANLLVKISGNPQLKAEFDLTDFNPSAKSSRGMLSIEKIKKLGWSPKIDEEEGFKRTIQIILSEKNK